MASTFVFSCPKCRKQLQGPADLEGKTIRCKACGNTFVVKPVPVSKPAADGRNSKTRPKPAAGRPDEEAALTPYGVTTEKLKTRCPHCAAEMESNEAVICLECGYNTITRQHLGTKKIAETTGGDFFLWLLPGFLCVGAVCFMILIDVITVWYLLANPWKADGLWFKLQMALGIWIVIFSFFGMYSAGRFAIKRLIFNPTPPEEENR